MKVGSIIGLACVAVMGLGATGTLIYVASHRPQALDLPRCKFVSEFTNGRSQVSQYTLDNHDGKGVSKVTAGFEARGLKKWYSDGFVVYELSPSRTVTVQVPPTYLGVVAGKHRFRSAGGREYDIRGKVLPKFDTLQLNVVDRRSELLAMF